MPAADGDDPGSFVVAPALARLLDLRRGTDGLRLVYMLLFGLGVAIYPLLFFKLFGSLRAALVAPFALLAGLLFVIGNADVYWASGWAVLVLAPILLWIAIRRPRWTAGWLAIVALGASLATSLRAGAGLGVALACLALALIASQGWRSRALSVAVVIAAYLAVTPLGVAAVERYRDAQLSAPLASDSPSSHLFWHPLYLGLGFLPNRYGITWRDSIAIAAAQRVDAQAPYPSSAYDHVVRGLFMKALREDPGQVASIEWRKTIVAVGRAPVILILAILAVLLIALAEAAWLVALLVLVPCALTGILSGLVGVPDAEYVEGWLGVLVLLAALGIGLAASLGRHGLIRVWRDELRWRRPAVKVAAATCAMVLVAAAVTPELSARCRNWQGSVSLTQCGGSTYPLPLQRQ
jgi:hypothetical protein